MTSQIVLRDKSYSANEAIICAPYCIVWARIDSKNKFWPGLIITEAESNQEKTKNGHCWIYWFQDQRVSEVPEKNIFHFIEHFNDHYNNNLRQQSVKLYKAVVEGLLLIEEHLKYSAVNDINMIKWAKHGCPIESNKNIQIKLDELPKQIASILNQKKNKHSSITNKKERDKLTPFQLDLIRKIKKGEKTVNSICIACVRSYNDQGLQDHPYFEFKVCKNCREKLLAINEKTRRGPDGVHYNCFICAQAGEVFCCCNTICGRVFCLICIGNLCEKEALQYIKGKKQWLCFLCPSKQKPKTRNRYNGLLRPRKVWKITIPRDVKAPDILSAIEEQVPLKTYVAGLKIMSVFHKDRETMGALLRSHLYDKFPKLNFLNVDNVRKLLIMDIEKLVPIDFLIFQMPNFGVNQPSKDPQNMAMFFEFYRIKRLIEQWNGNVELLWLLESGWIGDDSNEYITRFLEVKTMTVNELTHARIWCNLKC